MLNHAVTTSMTGNPTHLLQHTPTYTLDIIYQLLYFL